MAHSFLRPESDDGFGWLVLNVPDTLPPPQQTHTHPQSSKSLKDVSDTPTLERNASAAAPPKNSPAENAMDDLKAKVMTSMPLTMAITASFPEPLPFNLPFTPEPAPLPAHLEWLLASCPSYRHTSTPKGQALSPAFHSWLQSFSLGTNVDPPAGSKLQSFEAITIALLRNHVLPSTAMQLRQEMASASKQGVTFNRKKFKGAQQEVIWEALGGRRGKRFLEVRGGGRVLREGRGNYLSVGDIVLVPRPGDNMHAAGVVVTPFPADYRLVRVAGLWEELPDSPPESPDGSSDHDCDPIECSKDRLRQMMHCNGFVDDDVDHVRGRGAVAIANLGALLQPCFPTTFNAETNEEDLLFYWVPAGTASDRERQKAADFYKARVRRANASQTASGPSEAPVVVEPQVSPFPLAMPTLVAPRPVAPVSSPLVRPVPMPGHSALLRCGYETGDDDEEEDIWR